MISGVTPSEDFAVVFAYALGYWSQTDARTWRTGHGVPTASQVQQLRAYGLLP